MKLSSYPHLVKEWHPTKNGELTPNDFTHASGKRVWWLCPKNHSYDSIIANRAVNKSGCPYCAGQKASEDNNLLFLFPEIAKEWHPTKNNELTPKQVTHGSKKKVWWLCPKGHSYKTTMNHRTSTQKSGCPYCSNQSSEPEIRILSELKWFFDEVNSRYKVDGVEVDIFLPNFNLAIEYDGSYWHRDKKDIDLEKNKFLLSQDINLIRVREHPLKSLSENDIVVSNYSLAKTDLDKILKNIIPFVDNNIKEKIADYFDKSSFVNEELFKEYRSYFPSPFPENSLLKRHPLISAEWDYDKNYPLRPENFSYGSGNKMWWLCSKGHSYESVISGRTHRNRGCPYCAGQKTLNYDLFK
jgi:very-short-patch-repair endonuclease